MSPAGCRPQSQSEIKRRSFDHLHGSPDSRRGSKTKAPTDFLVERQETFGDMACRPAWPQVIKDKWGTGGKLP
jgi:hypothetical protein